MKAQRRECAPAVQGDLHRETMIRSEFASSHWWVFL